MKPVDFGVDTVRTLDEAVAFIADTDAEVKLLAGGQSLIPLLNFRLAVPDRLVDINHLSELSYVRRAEQGMAIGAMTRERVIEHSAEVAGFAPLLTEAMPFVGHPPIRNRGTVGGSLAHADAASEICAVMLALDAQLVAVSVAGRREISVRDFFVGPLTTALSPQEMLTEIRIPPRATGGWAFEEVARRRGDFAVVGVAALVSLDGRGNIDEVRLAYASMGPKPLRGYETEAALKGQQPLPGVIAEAAKAAVAELEPREDLQVSREYRAHVAEALTRRALARSIARAAGPAQSGGGDGSKGGSER